MYESNPSSRHDQIKVIERSIGWPSVSTEPSVLERIGASSLKIANIIEMKGVSATPPATIDT